MKSFKEFTENVIRSGQWQNFEGMGYTVQITQHSNKGPLFIILNQEKQQIGRAYFNLFDLEWKITD